MRYFAIVSLLALCFVEFSFADEVWEFVDGINEADIREVCVDEYNKGVIYCSSLKRLYRSEDNGNSWRGVFSARGDGNVINFINVSEEGVFVCTEKGVYRSVDGKSNWKGIFEGVGEENSALHIAFSEDGDMYLGTEGGLFMSDDNGEIWQKDLWQAGNMSVKWVAFLGKDVFIASEKGVYKKIASGWERVFVTSTEEAEYDSDVTDTAIRAERPVNSIFVNEGKVFLSTDVGIFVSEDKGNSWRRFISDGPTSRKVKRLLFKELLYAVTNEGIFIFDDKDKIWRSLYTGMATNNTQSISVDNKGSLWAATDKGLYKSKERLLSAYAEVLSPSASADKRNFVARNEVVKEERDVLKIFDYEPSINEVQKIAIEYAEVHPDKIREWRESAKKKAFLPSVSVGFDRYVTDYYHWDAGQNPDVLQKGDDVVSWDVTMTWNLDELIWNSDQTSIDTRSRLMVQLRDDILDEVTRTYFERRRLQIEMYLSPPSDAKEKMEKELRIQELTADLDALTGGYFSEQMK